ncbi:membrane protein [Streptomyces gulbargensis]|uniref:Membrane protein n=1 Tax=Streptomyces gulbargensis TaxID=364901 RepID=A0ABP7LIN7_9ACTN
MTHAVRQGQQLTTHTGAVSYMYLAAEKGDITTIIGGIAPNWGPFGSLGNEAKVMIEVVMAVAILLCLGIAIWGAAKQRIGATALRDTFSAEQGKGLIVAGLTGVFIIGSLGTLFTIVYGMAV